MSAVSDIQPRRDGGLRRRVGPTLATFVVSGAVVYATAWLALGILRHIVMPIVAVIIAFYVAREVYRRTGR